MSSYVYNVTVMGPLGIAASESVAATPRSTTRPARLPYGGSTGLIEEGKMHQVTFEKTT